MLLPQTVPSSCYCCCCCCFCWPLQCVGVVVTSWPKYLCAAASDEFRVALVILMNAFNIAHTHTDMYACMHMYSKCICMHTSAQSRVLSRNMPAGGPELSALWQQTCCISCHSSARHMYVHTYICMDGISTRCGWNTYYVPMQVQNSATLLT